MWFVSKFICSLSYKNTVSLAWNKHSELVSSSCIIWSMSTLCNKVDTPQRSPRVRSRSPNSSCYIAEYHAWNYCPKNCQFFHENCQFSDFETWTFLCYEIHASWFLSSRTSFATNFISSFIIHQIVHLVIIATILLAFNFKFAATYDPCTSCWEFAFGSNNWANPLSKPSLKDIDMKEHMWRLSGTNFWVCTYCLLKQLHTLDNYSLTSSTQQFGKGPKL